MAVYVDELQRYPKAPQWPWGEACHLTADAPEDLVAFARGLGLEDAWLQGLPGHRVPHYDLTASKRRLALQNGAVFIPARTQARARILQAQKEASHAL